MYLNKKTLVACLAVAAFTWMTALYLSSLGATTIPSKSFAQDLGYHSTVVVELNGKEIYKTHNVLTNLGKNHSVSQLFSAPTAASATDIVSIMMLGNTTPPVATSTSHPGNITDCNLTQATGLTWSPVLGKDGNVTTSYTFKTQCLTTVNTTGLETATSHTYFAGAEFTDVTFSQVGDELKITWYVWQS